MTGLDPGLIFLGLYAVPPVSVSIYDPTGRLLTSVVGPLREGSDLSLTCKVTGGKDPAHHFLYSNL
jgi:hypothetical protein